MTENLLVPIGSRTGERSGPAEQRDRIKHPLWLTYQWELEKLTAQFRTRLALVLALLGPALFAVGLKFATDVPADTLFGRWVTDSGYAVPLVVLGFAGSWGFPLLVCLIAGDIFSAEDHYRTWTSLLTRSVGRRSVFGGKVLAAATYSVLIVVLLTVSSVLSGLLLVGRQPLVGLSGNLLGSSQAALLVLSGWASVLPAVLSFAALGVLVSVATRNSLAGILVPTVLGLLLQLLLLVGGVMDGVRAFLPGASFVAWVGLFAAPSFVRPMLIGVGCSLVYGALFLMVAWTLFRRRDVTGA
ncbi:ABC transporter permease [Nakamurella sp. PAMC28650]|uniref:ABC transporter permease n=1 Tax=Nakamurella sp. PAMC28650 TaxID=2762325 RepID=UPI00164EB9EC|nr:ABC transporter permease [Nakamurella sp. PAMC28650]QNK79384.1 ABC transporter permease [Nakamurella sp. PAMC28650]